MESYNVTGGELDLDDVSDVFLYDSDEDSLGITFLESEHYTHANGYLDLNDVSDVFTYNTTEETWTSQTTTSPETL